MKNLIAIQDEYIASVNTGFARWSHRKDGGHYSRIRRGAFNRAMRRLTKLGFNREFASILIDEAEQVALLIRDAEDN